MSTESERASEAEVLFEVTRLRHATLSNRLIRSATYEGLADINGIPQPELADLYLELAEGGVGTIITGFAFVSPAGRAMQQGQCGIDTDERVQPWRDIVNTVRGGRPDIRMFMQIAHAGRQTRREVTGSPVAGVSSRRCTYFKQKVRVLNDAEILAIVQDFGNAARRALEAGFDGVQVHAAHGYLIHQFLSPWTNTRTDKWGDGRLFLEEVICDVRDKCGSDFPVLVKLSWADDNEPGINIENTISTAKRLDALDVDAIEVSYGTMELALNIIRGDCPVDVILRENPLFNRMPGFLRKMWKRLFLGQFLKQLTPFSVNYNVDAALRIMEATRLPVIPVGGIRTVRSMAGCVNKGLSAVSLCRPLVCEPNLPMKIRSGKTAGSQCSNCNLCTAHCDSPGKLRCYGQRKESRHANT